MSTRRAIVITGAGVSAGAPSAWAQPTRFERVIRQGTARALGLALPRALQLRVDEVID
jgi:hypothetical protein